MYKIKWDKTNNGIILSNKINLDESIIAPRPVFSEELNLFGFDKYWKYNNSEFPLLWAIGRNYYYKGDFVASINGGNLYDDPQVNLIDRELSLKPIDLNKLIEKNHKSIIVLENESKRFINSTFMKHKGSHSIGVAFSGGKDSQVIIDLVSQVIAPEDYFTVFTDTQMELPTTYKTVVKTMKFYQKRYDNFKILTANQSKPIIENWNDFGAPSRLQRWCCSVCKTAPYLSLIKKLNPSNKPLVVYEGVRGEESNRRMKYERISKGKKHLSITNARPIFNWNVTEVYLYLFYRNIELNPAYRYGLTRVGCMICPFSSDWSEYIIGKIYPNEAKMFIDSIVKSLPEIGINDEKQQKQYIKNGQWKKRAGGKSLNPLLCSCEIIDTKDKIEAEIINPNSNIFEWLKILKPKIRPIDEGHFRCEVFYGSVLYGINIILNDSSIKVILHKANNNPQFPSIIKKIIYKTTYCSKCGVCIAECPQNAISFNNDLSINANKCISCLNCIDFVDKGCILAKSRHGILGGNIMMSDKINFDRYSTFGLREEWLINYFNEPSNWKNGLGTKQIPAFRRWLLEAQLINDKNISGALYHILKKIKIDITWSIIWVNLCESSPIIKWYSNLPFKNWVRNELNEDIFNKYPQYSEGTLKNPVNALLNTFDNSEYLSNYLQLGVLTKKGRSITDVNKLGSNNIIPIALLYCIYKYAEKNGYYDFTLTELYKEDTELTPYRVFGIEKEYLESVLRGLQENKYKFIKVEFAANLDNIFLNDKYTALEMLEIMLKGK